MHIDWAIIERHLNGKIVLNFSENTRTQTFLICGYFTTPASVEVTKFRACAKAEIITSQLLYNNVIIVFVLCISSALSVFQELVSLICLSGQSWHESFPIKQRGSKECLGVRQRLASLSSWVVDHYNWIGSSILNGCTILVALGQAKLS